MIDKIAHRKCVAAVAGRSRCAVQPFLLLIAYPAKDSIS